MVTGTSVDDNEWLAIHREMQHRNRDLRRIERRILRVMIAFPLVTSCGVLWWMFYY